MRYAERLAAPERIRYRSLLLNLNDFYRYNAGPVVPPQSCLSQASQIIGSSDSVPDYLRTIGESPFYNQPVYLDERSILQLEDNLYRYRTIVGVDTRESESDLIVDCSNPNQVRIVRVRYYDDEGQLSEVEEIDQVQSVSAEPPNTAKYNANQLICRDTDIGRTIPQEVTYERYSNDRFDFSILNFKILEIRYDRALQPEFDPVVAKIADSFSSNPAR